MSVKLVSTTVQEAKEVKDVRVALKDVVSAIRQALADGFQLGEDLPHIVTKSYASLIEAVRGFEDIPAAFKEETAAALNSSGLLASEVTAELLKEFKGRKSAVLAGESPEPKKVAKKTKKKTS